MAWAGPGENYSLVFFAGTKLCPLNFHSILLFLEDWASFNDSLVKTCLLDLFFKENLESCEKTWSTCCYQQKNSVCIKIKGIPRKQAKKSFPCFCANEGLNSPSQTHQSREKTETKLPIKTPRKFIPFFSRLYQSIRSSIYLILFLWFLVFADSSTD